MDIPAPSSVCTNPACPRSNATSIKPTSASPDSLLPAIPPLTTMGCFFTFHWYLTFSILFYRYFSLCFFF